MSLEDVEKKVLASAEQEAKEIVEKAEAEAKAQLERRGEALRDEQARSLRAAKADARREAEREVTTRRAEHIQKVLQTKNEILDAVFEQARQRVLDSQGFDYGAWLAARVRQAVEHGEGVLHCNGRDRQSVEAVLAETGTQEVTLAEEDAEMAGGVLLVGPSRDLDLTLDSALEDLRYEMAVSLAERLFADVPPIAEVGLGEEA
ncbi:MAG: V-type ATP synthase subunit E [Candidatus Brocadiia bacterium]